MSEYFQKPKCLGANVKVESGLSNYVTISDLKNAADVDTSDVDPTDVDIWYKNILSNLRNLTSKIDKLDVDKLVPVPVDLSILSDVVRNNAVKKDVYNAKVKDIEDKIPDITNLATNTTLLILI